MSRPIRRRFATATLAAIVGCGALLTSAHAQPAPEAAPHRYTDAELESLKTGDLVRLATESFNRGDVGDAVRYFEASRGFADMPAHNPPIALIFAVADHHLAQGSETEREQALATYNMALELFGNRLKPFEAAMARARRAEIYSWQNQFVQAEAELASLRETHKDQPRALLLADLGDANLLLARGQAGPALQRLTRIVETGDELVTPLALYTLGIAHLQMKDNDKAIEAFRELCNKHAGDPFVQRVVLLSGQVFFDRGDFLAARKLYEAAAAIGAAKQTNVLPGDELVVKVTDGDYYIRTRQQLLEVTLRTPSGDEESVRLEKNPISDQLYVGRVPTRLASPAHNDGTLQVAGGDVIDITYPDQPQPFHVAVVDDGKINIDSVPLAAPKPRGERTMPTLAARERASREVERVVLPLGRMTGGSIAPGGPVYVQLIDADFDTTAEPDTTTAVVHVTGGTQPGVREATVKLTETGPRTGVFEGVVSTSKSNVFANASSSAPDHGAMKTITRADEATYWQAAANDDTPWMQIDLRQPAKLGKLTWTVSESTLAAAPRAMHVILAGDNADRAIPVMGEPKVGENVVDLRGTFARFVRFEIDKLNGPAPILGAITITDVDGNVLVPGEAGPQGGSTLEFDVGQQIYAAYNDGENQTPGRAIERRSRQLGVRYFDASIAYGKTDENAPQQNNRDIEPPMLAVWRLDLKQPQFVIISDADADTTVERDTIAVTVTSESGDSIELTLTETGLATGVFRAPLPLTTNPEAKGNPRLLAVSERDQLWVTYLDEKNMQPGHRTFRHGWVMTNRPAAGELLGLPLVTTAWPYEVRISGDGESEVVPRVMGQGHQQLRLVDADAVTNAGQTLTVKASGLLSAGEFEVRVPASGAGEATQSIDFILGDAEDDAMLLLMQPEEEETEVRPSAELNVPGDEMLRLSYKDARVPTVDMALRPVLSLDAVNASSSVAALLPSLDGQTPQAYPVITLEDPTQRIAREQKQLLADVKAEMDRRLRGYEKELQPLLQRRDILQARLDAAPLNRAEGDAAAVDTQPAGNNTADALTLALKRVDDHVSLQQQRVARLRKLGADASRATPRVNATDTENTKVDEAQQIRDGALIPGQPFEVVVKDADLTGKSVEVELRSLAGRMIDTLVAQAVQVEPGIYRVRVQTERGDEPGRSTELTLMPGGEVLATYRDPTQTEPSDVDRFAYVALASDAVVEVLNSTYTDIISEVRMGAPLHLQVTDYDADRSPELELLTITARSTRGDELLVALTETEPHSGVFRGQFITDDADPLPADDRLQATYGGQIEIEYGDYLRQSGGDVDLRLTTVQIAGGSVGSVEAFARQFASEDDELELWYLTGQCAYQVGRGLYLAGARARADGYLTESADYLQQVIARAGEDELAARANYYLGNVLILRGRQREAVGRFRDVIARWPDSSFVAQARYKLAQCYESVGQFDRASDQYVLLAYHHPDDALVPMAMLRMMNHFARNQDWEDAIAIATRFVDKFEPHEYSGEVALKAGQWLLAAEKSDEAVAWYTKAEKIFATNDRAMAGLLYWHAATLIQMGQGRGNTEKVRELLNRVVYDYSRSEYAPLAQIALQQILDADN